MVQVSSFTHKHTQIARLLLLLLIIIIRLSWRRRRFLFEWQKIAYFKRSLAKQTNKITELAGNELIWIWIFVWICVVFWMRAQTRANCLRSVSIIERRARANDLDIRAEACKQIGLKIDHFYGSIWFHSKQTNKQTNGLKRIDWAICVQFKREIFYNGRSSGNLCARIGWAQPAIFVNNR